jgi:hypothetical protein
MKYDSLLAKRVVGLKPSGIRRFFDLAATMEGPEDDDGSAKDYF